MNNELDKLVFSTKSIMITDKQKELIENAIEKLNDFDNYDYNDIEYWKLSKRDASKLISNMFKIIEDLTFEAYWGGDMYTDGFKD